MAASTRLKASKPPVLGIGGASPTTIAGMSYGDLLAALRKDLQPDLSVDVLQHTGNDVPGPLGTPGGWALLSPYYVNNWITHPGTANPPSGGGFGFVPMMFIDANGWVNLRGWMRNSANYSFATPATSTILNLPQAILPKGVQLFVERATDGAGNESHVNIQLFNIAEQNSNPSFGGNVFIGSAVGTNGGSAGGFVALDSMRWNYRS